MTRIGGTVVPMTYLAALLGTLTLVIGVLSSPSAAASREVSSRPEVPIGTWPLTPQPEVLARFDPPASTYGRGHRGVDLAGLRGQAVRSALPGQVSFAGTIAGKGVVVISHGATRTTYEPVTAVLPVGSAVEAGQVIGSLQLLGSHCFPRVCLHWGWLRGELYLDPLLLVGVRRVRLLPLNGRTPALSPGMGLLIGPPQPIGRDMRIELGGVQGRVPQQFLHSSQIRPTLQ
jgi:murein DD-endopeptidase MepM/ murein hydrolase activator NlpD